MCFYEVHRGVLKKALLSFKINKVIFQEGTSMFKNKVNFLKKDVVGVCVIVSFTYKVYRNKSDVKCYLGHKVVKSVLRSV